MKSHYLSPGQVLAARFTLALAAGGKKRRAKLGVFRLADLKVTVEAAAARIEEHRAQVARLCEKFGPGTRISEAGLTPAELIGAFQAAGSASMRLEDAMDGDVLVTRDTE